MYKWLLLVIIFVPFLVFASEDIVKITVKNDVFTDLVFDVANGSKHNVSFVVENTSDTVQNIVVRVVGDDDTKSLVSRTKFFIGELDEIYEEQLQQNNGDVVLFCEKQTATNAMEWCKGNDEAVLSLQPSDTVIVPAVIDIADDEVDHTANIVVQKEGNDEIIDSAHMIYHVPDKNIVELALVGFSLNRSFNLFDLESWFNAGLKDQYNANIIVENIGTEKTDYAYCVSVQSLWIDESVDFCNNAIIEYNNKQEHVVAITVPRFGKTHVISSLQYTDEKGQTKKSESDLIKFTVWPIQMIVMSLFFICFCGVGVLLYEYITKNMFGRKKKKKQENRFTGSYVVKDTDNIISIAQLYGVAWKELAKINNIDPPYILISGETINVPGDEDNMNDSDTKDGSSMSECQQNECNIPQDNKDITQPQGNNNLAQASSGAVRDNDVVIRQQDQREQSAHTTNGAVQSNNTTNTQGNNKRKITYASQKNMLTKPASEPMTRAIDIEWMNYDETVYNEEMQTQKKKMNTRFIIIIVFIIVVFGLIGWWCVMWFLNSNDQNNVSVDALIEEQLNENNVVEGPILDEQDDSVTKENDVAQDAQNDNEEKDSIDNKEVVQNDSNDVIAPSETIIQVLNAGAPIGSAGTLTDIFAQKGYKTDIARNAQNDYEDVVIYYSADAKDRLDAVSAVIPEKYGTQKHEESDETTKKYEADLVVVLGL